MSKITKDFSGLEKLQENLKAMEGTQSVRLAEVVSPQFVSANTKYPDFDALLTEVGITTAEEFEAYPEADFDAFIAANTRFSTWREMQEEAVAAYAKAQLLKGMGR